MSDTEQSRCQGFVHKWQHEAHGETGSLENASAQLDDFRRCGSRVKHAYEMETSRAHSLAHDERLGVGVVLVGGRVFFELVGRGVHWAVDVGVSIDRLEVLGRPAGFKPRVLVLHGTRHVGRFEPGVGAVEGDAVARLVAERPNNDARVVLVALVHAHHALHVRVDEVGPPGERSPRLEPHAVRLDVGLVNHI
eukprot:6214837-Pleurochrysis_carterae.AAC.19